MALVVYDRVQETTSTTGTGTVTLNGAVAGYQSFAVVGNGNTTFYCILNGTQWEVGIGTYTSAGTTLARTTILSNSAGNTSPITLSGDSLVFVTYPSEKSVNLDASNNVTLPAQLNLVNTALTSSNTSNLNLGGPLTFNDTGIICDFVATTNSYLQAVVQNKSNGTAASAEFIAYNDAGTASTNFATFGINSSGYTGTGAINGAGYGYFLSGSTDMVLGTIGANAIHFVVNSGATDAMTISSTGNVGIQNTNPNNPLSIASSTTLAAGTPSVILQGASNTERYAAYSSGGAAAGTSVYLAASSRGTVASPTATQSGDVLGYFQLGGYNGTGFIRGAWVGGIADGVWSGTNQGSIIVFSTTPNASTTITDRMRIASGGNVSIGTGADGTAVLHLKAGTATASTAPLKFTAGTNLTTAEAGAVEYDGSVFYGDVAASTRGTLPSEQMVVLNTAYTLTSQTAAQKLFNNTTNGAVTLPVGTYQFECVFALSAMSATSGSFGFALGGAATKTERWLATVNKVATSLATAATGYSTTWNTAANTTLIAANVNTLGYAWIRGTINVTVAGTVIPQVSLGVAAAAVVGVGSYFKISAINGTSGATNNTVGNWS